MPWLPWRTWTIRTAVSCCRCDGWKIRGPPAPPVQAALPEPYAKGRVYFASSNFSRMLSLHPWVVLAKCPLCFQRELFFYVATRGEEVSYVTPDRGHSWSCLVPADWQNVLAGH